MSPAWLGLGDLLGYAAALGHLVQGLANIGSEDDDTARAPRCAAAFGGIAEHLYWSTGEGYFLQLSRRKEAKILAIGRPKGECWPLDFHLADCAGGYVPHPQPGFGNVTGKEGELRTIRRKCQGASRDAGENR